MSSDGQTSLPPLVLLPGMMCDARLWADMAPQLGAHAALHYGDLTLDDTLAAMAGRVLATAPDRFHLCGFSMGGYVAREIVLTASERVLSLILVNTSSAGTGPEELARHRDMARLVEAGPFTGLTRGNLKKSVDPGREHDSALLDRIQQMARDLGPTVFARQLRLVRDDGRVRLADIACPTLVVAARGDRLRGIEDSRILAAGIPSARLEIMENCGHMTPLERPEALNALIVDWLS